MKKKTLLTIIAVLVTGGIAIANQDIIRGLGFVAPTINGKTNVSYPAIGEIIFDDAANKFYGQDNAGNWLDMTAAAIPQVPVGTVVPYVSNTAPTGYLIADGTAVSRTTYADLFALVGTTYGAGDGSTTFNLPNLKGVFIRGAGSQTIGSVSYSATLNTFYNDTTKKNGLALSDPGHRHHGYSSGSGGTGVYGSWSGTASNTLNSNYISESVTTGVSLGSGDSETRPVNVALTYIIKY